MKRIALLICFAVCLFSLLVSTVFAHPGRTDGNGGHTNHSTGEYHYHHGYSPHDHYDMDGDGDIDCPYGFNNKTASISDSSQKKESIKTVKKTSFFDVLEALFINFFPSLVISFILSLILSYVLFFLFGDDKGWTLTCVVFLLISAVVYVRLVLWHLE